MKRQFKAELVNGNAEIIIFDVIGDDFFGDGVSAVSVKKELDSFHNAPVTVHINSPGGDIFQGIAIYNLLNAYTGRVTVEIDGIAASAASVIAMAGDEIHMAANAIMMIHSVRGFAGGTAEELRERAEQMDRLNNILVGIYAARTGQTEEVIKGFVTAEESNFTAAEALELNLATEVTPNKEIAAQASSWLRAQAQPDHAVPVERKQNNNQGTHMKIAEALGLASDEAVIAAYGETRTFQNGVVTALGAKDPADAIQLLNTMRAKADRVDALDAQLTVATAKAEEATITAQIEKLDAEKKLSPAMHPLFRSLDAKARDEFIANAPVLVSVDPSTKPKVAAAVVALTPEDEKILALSGAMDRETYIKYKGQRLKDEGVTA